MRCTSSELRSASSYGHFTAAKEFRSQCHILNFVGARSVELKGCQTIFQKRELIVKTVVKNKLRIQGGHFSKNALNWFLTLSDYRYRRELSIDVLYVTRASICVELWPKQIVHRISVLMSYSSLTGKRKYASYV